MAVEVSVAYLGKLACRATHGPSGATVETTAPKDNGGDGSKFSPTDLVATALGTCVATIMAMTAERRGIDLRTCAIKVEKHMSTEAPRRIVRLPVVVTFDRRLSADDEKALMAAANGCPVHRSIHADIESPITFDYPAS
jgi:putative redox protein